MALPRVAEALDVVEHLRAGPRLKRKLAAKQAFLSPQSPALVPHRLHILQDQHYMPKRLFISHSWSYSERYVSMLNLLNSRPYFNFINYSVPETKAFGPMANAQMKEQLRSQIRPAQCVIIIGGMWTNHSDWIQFEMDFASSIGKPILGVRPRSAKVMPQAVVNISNLMVNWNADSIVAGIRQIS